MRLFISFILCVAIVAGGAGIIMLLGAVASKSSDTAEKDAVKPVNVQVATLAPLSIEDVVVLTGRVEPWENITVSAEVSGNVEWQGVDDGAVVKAGDELFRIDTIWYQAAHTQAEAQALLAGQELARIEGLRKSGISSPQELDRAESERKVANANVAAASTRLNKSVMRAPVSGIVDEVFLRAGEWADTGTPLARLVQTDRVKVIIGAPERDMPHFHLGDPVEVVLDAFHDETFSGEVYRIATTAERETRTFAIEIELSNPQGRLKPGMIARARMVRETFPEAIAVPVFSVLSMENQRFAVVEEGGIARIRAIEVGVLQGDQVHVTKGLQSGDRLIVVGHRDLRDGQPVAITGEAGE